MSKYTITHTCGHEQIHQLYGPTKDRDRKAKWLETTLCTECWKAQQQSERAAKIAAENERAAALAAENKLPLLSGSEKQIAWATSIRQGMIDSMDSFIAECGHADEWSAKFDALRAAFAELVLANTESRWFIDQRDYGTVRVAFGAQLVDWIKTHRPEVMSATEKQEAA